MASVHHRRKAIGRRRTFNIGRGFLCDGICIRDMGKTAIDLGPGRLLNQGVENKALHQTLAIEVTAEM